MGLNDPEVIRMIAELQKEYKAVEQDYEQLKIERNTLAMTLDFSDGAVKGCGITISKQVRMSITPEIGDVDPDMYAEYVRLKASLEGIEKALKEKSLRAGCVGLKPSMTFRVTGTPEV